MFFFDEESKNKTFKPKSIEHAYLAILNDDLETAQAVFESIESPRARWGLAFVDILKGCIKHFPTYFEIRNFLEIDLDFLLKNEKFDYVGQILSSLETLCKTNQEVYKYVARVMYENRLYKSAREYMEKSKSIFYNDPELHFMFARYYMNDRNYSYAKSHIEECLKIIPEYFPAIELQKQIAKYLA